MKNYWLDRIHERDLIVAARWQVPPDECGWYPLRPIDVCADAEVFPKSQPLHISQNETYATKRMEIISSQGTDFIFVNPPVSGQWSCNFDVNSEYAPDFDGYAFEK